MNTPQFLVWAVQYVCPVRGFQDGSDPERTERQLRAARAVSDAQHEGRVFEGFCVDPPNGFRIDDALAVYGGPAAVERACEGCRANAAARRSAGSMAGCFGIIPLSPDVETAMEALLSQRDRTARYEALFTPTNPQWYGLWMRASLSHDQCVLVSELLEALERQVTDHQAIDEMRASLRTAVKEHLPFSVELFPAGRVEGTAWKLVRHCPKCKAEWGEAAERGCHVCDYRGGPAPEKKRKARGQRPYFPLKRMLGERESAELLLRYEQFRARSGWNPPARSPLHEARPGNLQGD